MALRKTERKSPAAALRVSSPPRPVKQAREVEDLNDMLLCGQAYLDHLRDPSSSVDAETYFKKRGSK